MKPTALMTCNNLLLPEDLAVLHDLVELEGAGCALSQDELTSALENKDVIIMGGEEKLTLQAAQDSLLRAVIFVGKNFETFIPNDARAFLMEKNIPIYATGGGEASVAKTTVEEISTFWLIQGLSSRNMDKNKTWNPRNSETLLRDKELMIVGAGSIGREVISQLDGRLKKIYYTGGRGAKEELKQKGIAYEPDLATAFAWGDIVSVHMAFVPGDTERIIRYEHLKNMRRNTVLINNARAELFNADCFLKFLSKRPDVLCIWDVFWAEGEEYDPAMKEVYREIIRRPNFFFTQHTAAFRYPELTKPEYGRGLLKIVKEKILR